MTLPTVRFNLHDAQRASETWGANCGPGAIAAVCRLTLDELRPHLGDFESKRYTNPSLMWATLGRLGVDWRKQRGPLTWPTHGLVRIQWHGPWMNEGVPERARYRQTHWVGARTVSDVTMIFDINAINVGGWIPLKVWSDRLVPWLLRECVPRADGGWSITHVAEVRLREAQAA